MSSRPQNKGGIDPAALAVAALAAAISVVAPPGPYGPTSMIIGASILLFIFAYDKEPNRNPSERLAFSGICALITLLMFGYPLEVLSAGVASLFSPNGSDVSQSRFVRRLCVLFHDPEKDIKYSLVPPLLAIGLWLGTMAAYYRWYPALKRRLLKYDAKRVAASNDYPVTKYERKSFRPRGKRTRSYGGPE